jgi:hypothetical protein
VFENRLHWNSEVSNSKVSEASDTRVSEASDSESRRSRIRVLGLESFRLGGSGPKMFLGSDFSGL